MAESKREKQQREAKEAYASVWRRPERKSPVTEEGEPSEGLGTPSLGNSLNVRVIHPVFEMVREALRRDGFTHPEQGQFIMLPREFEAVLALENKAVVQVVFLILRETIGWTDEAGRHKRREWVQLGQKHFEITCGSKSQGFYGVKTAIQKGYILRRPYKNTFEYSIRWKEKKEE
jgi:hypothetical protein